MNRWLELSDTPAERSATDTAPGSNYWGNKHVQKPLRPSLSCHMGGMRTIWHLLGKFIGRLPIFWV